MLEGANSPAAKSDAVGFFSSATFESRRDSRRRRDDPRALASEEAREQPHPSSNVPGVYAFSSASRSPMLSYHMRRKTPSSLASSAAGESSSTILPESKTRMRSYSSTVRLRRTGGERLLVVQGKERRLTTGARW